jgi:hypothetical protein
MRSQEILDALNAMKLRNTKLQAQIDRVLAKLSL